MVGLFTVEADLARKWLSMPQNPNGTSNRQVIRPVRADGKLVGRPLDRWVIDFDDIVLNDAAMFEAPFGHLSRRHDVCDPKTWKRWKGREHW
jgi:hypothetical protein